MKRKLLFILLSLLTIVGLTALKAPLKKPVPAKKNVPLVDSLHLRYLNSGLEEKLDYGVFLRAIDGISRFSFGNDSILTIIDFTKPSYKERMFVLNLGKNTVLFESLVAHGKNSGQNYAASFSNRVHSLKSSPGFYSTAETYRGKHGYSLRLDGLEEGINDKARERAIVIHGANYVSNDFIERTGHLGRSWGCPALPEEISNDVIDLIKEGSCLYIHTSNSSYLEQSEI